MVRAIEWMMPVNYELLTPAEESEAGLFWKQLSPAEVRDVIAVLGVVDETAYKMLSGMKNPSETRYDNQGYPFYAVYSVAGMVTKKPPRPDIDLLLACNIWYPSQMDDPFQSGIMNFTRFGVTRKDIEVKVRSELRGGYLDGIADAKMLLEIQPATIEKKIHLIYVKSSAKKEGGQLFASEEEFMKLDIDRKGKPLPRRIIYRARLVDDH